MDTVTFDSHANHDQSSSILALQTRIRMLVDINHPGKKPVKWQVNLRFKFKSKFIIQGYLFPLWKLTCTSEAFTQD